MASVAGEVTVICASVEEQAGMIEALTGALDVPTSGVKEFHATDATHIWVRVAFDLTPPPE